MSEAQLTAIERTDDQRFVARLRDFRSDRSWAIEVDEAAGSAIAAAPRTNLPCSVPVPVLPRPQTHDLFANVLHALSIELTSIRIGGAEPGATLTLAADGDTFVLACCPADALALAARSDCAIFVDAT